MHQQIQIPLCGLPVNIICISNSQVAFVRVAKFKCIIDTAESEDQIVAIFAEDGFSIGSEKDLSYNVGYNYKQIPCMLKWLQQCNLQVPNFI